jgi:Septum formation initiator
MMSAVIEARTTTLIRRAPGRRASDANRSRLGDLTRPIAREQRIARDRRPALIFAISAIVIAGAIGAALFGLPVRTWFGQDDELERLDHELGELQGVNAELQSEVDRLQTEAGIREAAREELGLIEAGERRQTVAGWPVLPVDLPNGWPYSAVEQILAVRASGPP